MVSWCIRFVLQLAGGEIKCGLRKLQSEPLKADTRSHPSDFSAIWPLTAREVVVKVMMMMTR